MNSTPDTEMYAELFSNLVIDDFRVAIAIKMTGSLRRAADALGLALPTVSRRLSRLERALSVRLFDRGPSGLAITLEGQAVIADAVRGFETFQRIGQRPGVSGAPSGNCRLITGDGLASCWITRFLPSFFATHPRIDLQLNAATDKLGGLSEQAELRIHYWEPQFTSHVAARLGKMHLLCFASDAYVAKHGFPESREDFKGHTLLEIDYYVGHGLSWSSFTEGARSARLFANSSAVLVEAVRNGSGIALLPSYLASIHADLVHIACGPSMTMPLTVTYSREAGTLPHVRATLDFVKTRMFNRHKMPWFEDERHPPSAGWRDIVDELIRRPNVP